MYNIKEPYPKDLQLPIEKWHPKGNRQYGLQRLLFVNQNARFADVLYRRESRRSFHSVSEENFGELLALTHSCKNKYINDNGFIVEQRNVIASGALHAVHILFNRPGDPSWHWYEPSTHSAIVLDISSEELTTTARSFFDSAPEATVIWYVADIDYLEAKYDHPQSLLWRDAGAIQATHSLVCEHVGLSYCPLGIAGIEQAQLLSDERKLIGVGLAVVGDRM